MTCGRYVALMIASTAMFGAKNNTPPTLDPNQIGSTDQPEIRSGDKGSGVARAQILLARAHFSCGQIDGDFGTNLGKTVAAFQEDRKLPVSGNVDAATWAALNQDQAPVLVPYVIAD